MHKDQSPKHLMRWKNLIIFPFVFCVLILAVSTAVIYPSVNEFVNMSSSYFTDNDITYSTDYYNIFVPMQEAEEDIPEEEGTVESKPQEQSSIPLSSIRYPYYGELFGEIIIEDCQIHTKVYFGDGNSQLNKGAGMYTGGFIPGYGRTIMVAGHNNTVFHNFKYAQEGQKVKFCTNYGNYIYEITDIQVKTETDSSAYDFSLDYENLIMYTCYPFDELNHTPYRCFVYARLISGPVIDKSS